MAVEAEAMVIQTRQLLTRFFGFTGPAKRCVFTANVTDSLNMALAGLLKPGDHVVSTRVEHNAVLRTLNHLERDNGLLVTQVEASDDGIVTADAIKKAITAKTRAIVLNHAATKDCLGPWASAA